MVAAASTAAVAGSVAAAGTAAAAGMAAAGTVATAITVAATGTVWRRARLTRRRARRRRLAWRQGRRGHLGWWVACPCACVRSWCRDYVREVRRAGVRMRGSDEGSNRATHPLSPLPSHKRPSSRWRGESHVTAAGGPHSYSCIRSAASAAGGGMGMSGGWGCIMHSPCTAEPLTVPCAHPSSVRRAFLPSFLRKITIQIQTNRARKKALNNLPALQSSLQS